MAVLKQSSSRAGVTAGAVFSLGDLRVGAERALSDAQAEAARVLEAAKREGERIRAAAERDGFAKGHAEGFAKGEAEGRTKGESEGHAAAKVAHDAALQAIEEGFATELGRWMAVRDDAMRFAERELAAIAVSMAEGIVREHVKGDPTVVAREAEAAIGLFARATRVTIEVAPEDAPILAESMPRLVAALPEGAAVSIVSREGVARGGCVIRSSEGSVDARLETQFRRMREGLIGGAAPEAESSGDAGGAS
ncbi:MAG: Yop protein translocation protein [Planctomycetota bacterium]|jgi:flagellar biosynthesis/type III secretory pathway protein FliH